MLTNPRTERVKSLRRLRTAASARHDERRFLVEGAQAVREALTASTASVRGLYVSPDAAGRHADLVAEATGSGVPVTSCSDCVVKTLSDTVTPQGIVAVCDFVDRPLAALTQRSPRLVALLADVRDPGNAGSVVRAADAAGADGIVFAGSSVDPYNGKVVRASVGGIFHVPLTIAASVPDAISALKQAELQVLVADGAGSLDLDSAGERGMLARPSVWVFGNEAWGVPPEVQALADQVVRIPIYGRAESLNLATAAAFCLYASARAVHTAHRQG